MSPGPEPAAAASPPRDDVDRRIVNALQEGFPVCERPFEAAAQALDLTEDELIARIARMRADGTLTRFGPLYDVAKMGGAFTLAAMAVPRARFDQVAEIVNAFPEVAHNYERDHAYNLWFVLATESPARIAEVAGAIEAATGLPVLAFPKEREYFVDLRFTA